jgi:hypothetical protein
MAKQMRMKPSPLVTEDEGPVMKNICFMIS